MTAQEPEPGSELEAEGVPDMQDPGPDQLAAGDTHEAIPAPGDEPVGATEHGVTAEEQRTGESLDGRLAREQPDRPTRDQHGAGRLVAPDEGVREDSEPQQVGTDVGTDRGGFTAEEAAMREEEE